MPPKEDKDKKKDKSEKEKSDKDKDTSKDKNEKDKSEKEKIEKDKTEKEKSNKDKNKNDKEKDKNEKDKDKNNKKHKNDEDNGDKDNHKKQRRTIIIFDNPPDDDDADDDDHCECENGGGGNDDWDDETEYFNYYKEMLDQPLDPEPPREFITITKKVNTIADLIEIGKIYDYTKDYNIDVRTLHYLINPLTDLQNMIGMKQIKEDMVDHILFTIQKFDAKHQTMMHTVIEGPPGTGKTEVARIIGRIYLAMGILRNNKFIKASRSDLIAGYLGQTAIATQKIINSATGGILFIDEVYSLGNAEKRDSFSKECIDTINENLTSRKTDFICIIAGYKEDIKNCFFAYNAGLERRFPIRFRIEDYNADELFSIFKKKVSDNEWIIDVSIDLTFFEKHHGDFSFFGGDMELLFNSCKRSHSRRVFGTIEEKKLLKIIDLEKGFESFTNHKREKEKEDTGLWQTMFM